MKRLRKLHDAVKNRFAGDELATRSLETLPKPRRMSAARATCSRTRERHAADKGVGKALQDVVREAQKSDPSVLQLIGNAGVAVQGRELRAVNVVGGTSTSTPGHQPGHHLTADAANRTRTSGAR